MPGVDRSGMAGVAVLVIAFVTGCGAAHPASKPPARPTPQPTAYSGGLATLNPEPLRTPAPPLSAYGREVWITQTYLGDVHELDGDCAELRSPDCADAAQAWQLIAEGSAARIAALVPPAPGEPPLADVLGALSAYAAALQRISHASANGGQDVYDSAMSQLDAAGTKLSEAWGDDSGYRDEMYGAVIPPVAPASPFPAAPGRAPTARDAFTATAEKLDAGIEPVLAGLSTACAQVGSDACAAAIDPYEVDIHDVATQLRRTTPVRADEVGASAFEDAVFELTEAVTPLRDANRGGGGGFAGGLLRDGAWRLHLAVSILRDGAPPSGPTV